VTFNSECHKTVCPLGFAPTGWGHPKPPYFPAGLGRPCETGGGEGRGKGKRGKRREGEVRGEKGMGKNRHD